MSKGFFSSVVIKLITLKGNFDVSKMKRYARNPKARNEKTLLEIIRHNKDTEYGKKYHFEKIKTVEDFRRLVPICEYSDLEEDIERIYYKNENNILTKDKVIGFANSSGTISKSKIIPKTKRDMKTYDSYAVTRFLSIADKYYKEKYGYGIKPYKGINILQKDLTLSPAGLPSTNIGDLVERKYENLETLILVTPIDRQLAIGEADKMYFFSRFGLEEKDVMFIFYMFSKGVLEFIEYIKDNWEKLANEIELGIVDESKIYSKDLLTKLKGSIKPNKQRADEIRKQCSLGFNETILKRIWPHLAVISSVSTSSTFEGFTNKVKEYAKDVVIDYSVYGASEGLLAASYKANDKRQMLLSDSCYLEFVEEDDEQLQHILSIDELLIGKRYEIILTNKSGFYRYRIKDVIEVLDMYERCPLVNFVYRKGQLLNINGEKTTLEQMSEAIKRLGKLADAEIVDWCVDISRSNDYYRYNVLIENSDNKDLSIYEKQLEEILCDVNILYKAYKDLIDIPKILNLKPGAFSEWKAYKIESGAPESQVKPVKNLDTKEKSKFFYDRLETK